METHDRIICSAFTYDGDGLTSGMIVQGPIRLEGDGEASKTPNGSRVHFIYLFTGGKNEEKKPPNLQKHSTASIGLQTN